MRLPEHEVHAYTDGSCDSRTWKGGWGVYMLHKGRAVELYGGVEQTTNNQMELLAPIEALHALRRKCTVLVISDSQYVVQGVTQWMVNWKRKGWTKGDGEPIKNVDYWKELYALTRWHTTDFRWVKGHKDNVGNIKADELARLGRLSLDD